MNYTDLNKTQKRCIDAFITIRPALASQYSITRTEVETVFAELYSKRATGGEKIGYPMWLVKGEKVSRGHYKFPAPNLLAAQEAQAQSNTKVAEDLAKSSEEDKEFFAELREHGIMEVA